ncbi:Acetate kinase [Bremerella volcania]|uniref:Acetate kinase n=1 Tax=Bremerella volcania TaxID=2527984 RepID=A0A518CBI4_9BACT|nr:acetate/propionate family kinase [Bremerella volcania]QDU76534.1 Acetate kinase [Bremerella volcania]
MKVLVANLGSTSFKYRLFDMDSETQLARGGIDRIGSPESSCSVQIGDWKEEVTDHMPDHAVAVRKCLSQLTDAEHGCLKDAAEVSAIGFKAVHGGRVSGVQRVTDDVLSAMAEMNEVAPAHNPPYIAAMRLLSEQLPEIPLVAAFETGFHQTIPDRNRYYGIPKAWSDEFQIKKWGFHGASHRYIATRSAELLGRDDLRVISCHLGGSSSLCAINSRQSVAVTMGMSPQTGLPQNNRVGDFDPYALPLLMERTGKSLTEVLAHIGNQGGLLGLSGGLSGDMRDLEEAAANGNADAQLALDMFTSEVRRYLGGMLVELGGADAIVFTGGIGENGKQLRKDVCANLQELGIELDEAMNDSAKGEASFHSANSKTQLWVIPTNEEIIVARQTRQLLEST